MTTIYVTPLSKIAKVLLDLQKKNVEPLTLTQIQNQKTVGDLQRRFAKVVAKMCVYITYIFISVSSFIDEIKISIHL